MYFYILVLYKACIIFVVANMCFFNFKLIIVKSDLFMALLIQVEMEQTLSKGTRQYQEYFGKRDSP